MLPSLYLLLAVPFLVMQVLIPPFLLLQQTGQGRASVHVIWLGADYSFAENSYQMNAIDKMEVFYVCMWISIAYKMLRFFADNLLGFVFKRTTC